jgi:hypothetical protein
MDFTSIRKAALCATILMAAVLGAAPLWAQLTAGERHVLAPPAARSPEYGAEVALDGRFAAVGDPAGDAVHLFVHEPSSRSVAFSATLRPQDRWDGRFGTALAMAGGRLFVGAPEPTRDLDGQDDWRGDVVVFRESSGSWVRERVLRGSAPPSVTVDGFGSSLAANERHVLVAARDERALYAFDAVTGVAALQRIDVNARAPSAQAWDQLAGLMSLLLDGDSAVVGLKYDDYTAFHALRWSGARWEWEAEILRDELPESAYGGGASFRAGRLLIPTLRGVRHFERTPSGQWVERAVVASAAAFAGDGDLRRVSLAAAGAFVLELSALKFYSPNAGTWQVGGSIAGSPRPAMPCSWVRPAIASLRCSSAHPAMSRRRTWKSPVRHLQQVSPRSASRSSSAFACAAFNRCRISPCRSSKARPSGVRRFSGPTEREAATPGFPMPVAWVWRRDLRAWPGWRRRRLAATC